MIASERDADWQISQVELPRREELMMIVAVEIPEVASLLMEGVRAGLAPTPGYALRKRVESKLLASVACCVRCHHWQVRLFEAPAVRGLNEANAFD